MGAEAERALIEALRLSRAGREVCPDVLAGAARWALARYPEKDAGKAAKARLHQFYGSWVADGWAKRAGMALSELERGNIGAREAAGRLASLHSSTRERIAHLGECYAKVLDACGPVASVLDIACGLNPVSFYLLGLKDIALLALDAGAAVADALNRFFTLAGMRNARAQAADALAGLPPGRHDLALVMKFLPLAERMEKGGALRLLRSIDAAHIAVSFPTRSLSGRDVGMEKNYPAWFEGLGFEGETVARFTCGDELFYVVKPRERKSSQTAKCL